MIPIVRPFLPELEEYVELLREIWKTRMLSNFATMSDRLENIARDHLGGGHVLACSSGDIGLIVTLKALGLRPGAPCFISDFTFNSTINAALWNGLRPVLVDIEPASLNMSPDSLADAIKAHPQEGVVLATHVFGNPCDAERLAQLAADHSCYLVFDAAHAYGSRRGNSPVGTLGDAEIFSLSGTKPVTTAEGGLISTSHDWLAERIRYIRAYGFQNDYISHYIGVNGKLSELHAALGVLTLPHIESVIDRRGEIVSRYRAKLGTVCDFQEIDPKDRSTYKDVWIRVGGHLSEIMTTLAEHDVQAKRYFVPLHVMKTYEQYAHGSLDVTQTTYSEGLCIPAFADIEENEIDLIANLIADVLTAS